MLVRDRMISADLRVSSNLPISSVIEIYERSGVAWLPVVDLEGRLMGLLMPQDIQRARGALSSAENDPEKKLLASDFIRNNILSVTENTPIEEAARMMIDYDVADLPVVRDGFYTGVITEKIMLRVLMEITAARRQGVRFSAELENRTGALVELLELIRGLEGTIQGLCTYCAQDSAYMIGTMRVEGVDKYTLKQALRNAGYRVLDIR